MIAIIGTVGVPACYGGFETLVENMLNDTSEEYTVYCSSRSYARKQSEYKGAKLVYLPFNANGVASIVYDGVAMLHALFSGSKIFLILGVSAGLALPFLRLFTRRKLVTNIDGLEWRRDKWNRWAKWYLKISERAAVKYSHVVVADNAAIAEYVRREYGVESRVIAYGGDHVLTHCLLRSNEGYAFTVCRIEPENNVHLILEAFSHLDMPIKFVGNWSASEYGIKLRAQYESFSNISLIDPIYNLDTLFALRDGCDIYVHGHSAGGTNPSLVEAMFFGKPILAYDCAYNRASTNNLALFFSDVNDVKRIIMRCNKNGWTLTGRALEAYAQENYCWSNIRVKYENVFCEVAENKFT